MFLIDILNMVNFKGKIFFYILFSIRLKRLAENSSHGSACDEYIGLRVKQFPTSKVDCKLVTRTRK